MMSAGELRYLIERAILADRGELFWPMLASLERLEAEAEILRPKRKRDVVQAQLTEVRSAVLFDLRKVAASLAEAVERQGAIEQITSMRQSVHPTPADEAPAPGSSAGK